MARFIFYLFALVLIATALPHAASAQVTPGDPGNFITTWNTENPGTSGVNQITIPGTGAGYNYDLYWVNTASSTQTGSTTGITTSSYTITFPEPGIYRVEISGAFPRIYFNYGGNREKILTVEQWGDIAWTSMAKAFYGATYLTIPATDAPDLSSVSDMSWMFWAADSLNDSINHWDVSNVTNMGFMLGGVIAFNQPLDQWDTSNVTTMEAMFAYSNKFNQPLDNWNTENVTNMRGMFFGANRFNQPLNSWNISKVTRVDDMFGGYLDVNDFNQPLDQWNTSSSSNMLRMFWKSKFNQSIGNWDTSSVTNMAQMFQDTPFNQPIGQWNTNMVTTMSEMFSGATSFNQDISGWDIASTSNMTNMFLDAGLSQSNLDATITAWAGQAVQNNVPFHLGAKTYSSAGATALNTLRTVYNWDITEQYLLTYDVGPNASLVGDRVQQLDSGGGGTTVTVVPNAGYRFLGWSDGVTTPIRVDTNITNNRTLTASVEPVPARPRGTSAARQIQNLEEMGNQSAADALRRQFPGALLPLAPSHGFTFERPEQRNLFMAIVLTLFGLER